MRLVINRENIKTFVRKTLGCGCPEEVFGHIDCRPGVALDEKTLLRNKLAIGGRLLIYIMEVSSSDALGALIPFLVDKGSNERDSLGFNRARLVLVTDDIDQIKKAASHIFEKTQKDEKIHLHLIHKHGIPDFL